jgi:hypothetical protein
MSTNGELPDPAPAPWELGEESRNMTAPQALSNQHLPIASSPVDLKN